MTSEMGTEKTTEHFTPGWIRSVFQRVRLEAPLLEFVYSATDEQLEQVNRIIRELSAPPVAERKQ